MKQLHTQSAAVQCLGQVACSPSEALEVQQKHSFNQDSSFVAGITVLTVITAFLCTSVRVSGCQVCW